MPEIKHNFTGGKMNKDLDERIVPNGEYRHALNIQVGTTDNSDIGVVQNILGNKEITSIPGGPTATISNYALNKMGNGSKTIGSIAHPSEDAIYWFVKSPTFDTYAHNFVAGNTPPWTGPYNHTTGFLIGNNGAALSPEGSSWAIDQYKFIETTWNHGTFPSSAILEYKNKEIRPVVYTKNIVVKMWDSVLALNHYQIYSSSTTTTDYDPNGSVSLTVGGGHSDWINNNSYPFGCTASTPPVTDCGSNGFINGFGDTNNSNVIEVSDARGIKPGMKVNGWGVNQTDYLIKNYLPEDVYVIRVDYSAWEHNDQLIQSSASTPDLKLAKIILSKDIHGIAGTNNEKITHLEFVDNTLGFQNIDFITGVNILEKNIFWTDGNSIPKSINIEDGIIGSSDQSGNPIWTENTKLVVNGVKYGHLAEKHLAMAKPGPNHAPTINLIPKQDQLYKFAKITSLPLIARTPQGLTMQANSRLFQLEANITIDISLIDEIGGPIYKVGTILYASPKDQIEYEEVIENPWFIFEIVTEGIPVGTPVTARRYQVIIKRSPGDIIPDTEYSVMVQDAEGILEEDIGRFAVRYRYKHDQYSTIGPWSEPAFLPTQYDIESKEGVNSGMLNSIQQIVLSSLVPPNLREDIIGLDILYKNSISPSVYKIDSIDKNITATSNWGGVYYPNNNSVFTYFKQDNSNNLIATGVNLSNSFTGKYIINGKIKKSIIPELQTLRPWDNVPKKALAQEIVGNRIIYGNYTQGNDLLDKNGSKITTELNVSLQTYRDSIDEPGLPYKSIKSFRNYQIGVVFSDMYGRSTPVLTSQDSHLYVDLTEASEFNELNVKLNSEIPSWVDSYRFYVKGGEEEYYNLVQKNIYLSSNKETWIAFDSKDRNKITEEDTITLKIGGITNYDIGRINSYKVLSISNEAPESIKYTRIRRYNKLGREDASNDELIHVGVGSTTIKIKRHTIDESSISGGGVADCHFIRFQLRSLEDSNVIYPFEFLRITNIEATKTNLTTANEVNTWDITLEESFPETASDVVSAFAHDKSNIIIEMFEERKEDNIDFEGKFFVKIGADKDFSLALSSDTITNEYGVIDELKVFYYKENLLTAGDSKYRALPFDTDDPGLTWSWAGTENVTFKRPYNDKQERWGQFLLQPGQGVFQDTGLNNISQWATTWGNGAGPYSMTGGRFPLWDTPILGYVDANSTLQMESVGRSLGAPYEGTWFIDEGDYVGRLTFDTNSVITQPSSFYHLNKLTTTIGGSEFLEDGGITWANVSPTAGVNTGIDNTNNKISLSLGGSQSTFVTEVNSSSGGKSKRIKNGDGWMRSITEPLKESGEYPRISQSISRFQPGTRLRWAEDPNNTIYTISNVDRKVRVNYTRDDKMGSLTVDNTTTHGNFPAGFTYPHNFRQNWSITLDKPMNQWNPVNATPGSEITGGNTVDVTIGSTLVLEVQATTQGILTPAIPEGHGFLLTDAGDNARKLHPGMVLTDYPSIGTDVTSSDIRIHSIIYSEQDEATVVRLVDKTGSLNPNGTSNTGMSTGDILRFKQFSMDGTSEVMADRSGPIVSTKDTYANLGGLYDVNWITDNPNAVKKAIGYTLQVMKPAIETFQQNTGQSISEFNVWETSPKNIPEVDLYTEISDTFYPGLTSNSLENIIPIGANVYLDTIVNSTTNVSTLDNDFSGDIEFTVSNDDLHTGINSNSSPVLVDSVTVSDVYNVFPSNVGVPNVLFADNNKVKFSIAFSSAGTKKVRLTSNYPTRGGYTKVKSVKDDVIELVNANNKKTLSTPGQLNLQKQNPATSLSTPDILKITYENKIIFLEVVENATNTTFVKVKLANSANNFSLNYFNCYSFGNGVESVSIGDEFNKQRLLNNGRISSTIDWEFEEENISNGLIYSGVYNLASGLNNLNQFIQADKITKEINPTYGSIQKLFTRDSDLIAFCEDKILKILANKDALFNADGNTNLTASTNVLGQSIPFVGDYGISKNPESLASESYRLYFTDKQRGAVLRLSMDGLTPISEYGMSNWFKEHLKLSSSIIGSYDDNKDEYNLTLIKAKEVNNTMVDDPETLSYSEKVKGWVSFKSFIPENGVSLSNEYYTYKEGALFMHHVEIPNSNTQIVDNYNVFYGVDSYESEVEVLLNDAPSVVKGFYTLNYEGSQSKIDQFIDGIGYDIEQVYSFIKSDQEYYNLVSKDGWYVDSLTTDMDKGTINEFIEKEGKWFNYIKGKEIQVNSSGQITDI